MTAEPPPAVESSDPAAVIVPLTQAAELDADQIGGKAANLARLAAAGLPVPAGFVVPADAVTHPDRLSDVLPAAAGLLEGGRAAVRSSAVAEDLPGASYAGQYDSILDVAPGQLLDAIGRVRASAAGARVAAYRRRHPDQPHPAPGARDAGPGMAVLVQRMLHPAAAGVLFTANPLTGDRDETVITAAVGLGERLVAGQSGGEEWIVRADRADRTRQAQAEPAIDAGQARDLARLGRRVEGLLGSPQDIEWAIQDGGIWLLQARPMTALPDAADWTPPGQGVWLRNFRLGEWLPDPMTPLFEDWVLPAMLAGFHRGMRATAGAVLPFRTAAINGWYYTSPNPDPRTILAAILTTRGRILRFVWAALIVPFRDPAAADRRLLGAMGERWRAEQLPAYRRLVAAGGRDVATAQPPALVAIVEEIARTAGEHLWSLAVVGGAAWKMEAALARFLRHHLDRDHGDVPGMVRRLLGGLPGARPDLPPHAVHSIDPVHPTAGELGWRPDQAGGHAQHRRLAADRAAATAQCLAALAGDRRRQARFAAMLETAQRYAVVREDQARSLTLGWPLLRQCLRRLGHDLADGGIVDQPDDVFFLTRAELDHRSPLGQEVAARRATWARRRRLAAPLRIGTPPKPLARVLHAGPGGDRAPAGPAGTLVGEPASPGTVTGTVRVINDPAEFDAFQPGEILVTRTTAPAWTILFAKAAAVVTDAGTLAAHASLVAREYAIPAVVGTGVATTRLHTGQVVTVDGSAGEVRPRG